MTLAPESPTTAPLDELAGMLSGFVHSPGSDGYTRLGTPYNLAEQTHPLAVIEVETVEDVQATLRFAAAHDLEVGVRATGHGLINHLENVLLVHTGRFDELEIDPEQAVARAGAGVKWERVLKAAGEHGLAPLAGSSPDVGLVGYMTGGGIGPMARTYGVSSDRIRSLEVVTGDGEVRHVSATEYPDLFWALRGGKGALGIVTSVEFELVHLKTLYGGVVCFDAPDIPAVARTWAEWCPSLLEEATTSIAIMRLPEGLPFVPPELAGRTVIAVRFAWVGDPEDGARMFRPIESVGTAIASFIGVMPAEDMGNIHMDPPDPLPFHETAGLLREFTPETVEALMRVAGPEATDCLQLLVEIRQLGGAVAMAAEHASAFPHRDAAYTFLGIGVPMDPESGQAIAADGQRMLDELAPWLTGGAVPNFAGSTDPRSVRRNYDQETLERLAALIEQYDPKHVLRAGRPIRDALAFSE